MLIVVLMLWCSDPCGVLLVVLMLWFCWSDSSGEGVAASGTGVVMCVLKEVLSL